MADQRVLGKAIGLLSGLMCAALAWIFLFANPAGPVTAYKAGVWIIIVPGIGIAGLLAAIAALLGVTWLLVVLFAVSFFPFSLYLMLTPGIFHWFAVAEMGYPVAALLLRSRATKPMPKLLKGVLLFVGFWVLLIAFDVVFNYVRKGRAF